MRKLLLLSLFGSLLIACGGVKKTQEAINTGSYSVALNKAITNLAANKTKKRNQAYVVLLEEAFEKNKQRELNHIAFLQQEGNPANYEAIYTTYVSLKQIQQRIQPLLPLPILEEGRNAEFSFTNYDGDILAAKDKLSKYLYDNASNLLADAQHKLDYRKAYDDFRYLDEISPNYKDVRQKLLESHEKGIDYVAVTLVNDTQQIIPAALEEDLLNFNTYGLNDLWTTYHTTVEPKMNYDYEMQLAFRSIEVTPEQIREKQLVKEKIIKDGYKYALDTNGNVVRDSLGNKIKVDKFKTVHCDFYEFTQFKAAEVNGDVRFMDIKTKQELRSYPLATEFVFEHIYADYDGDKRALDDELLVLAIPYQRANGV